MTNSKSSERTTVKSRVEKILGRPIVSRQRRRREREEEEDCMRDIKAATACKTASCSPKAWGRRAEGELLRKNCRCDTSKNILYGIVGYIRYCALRNILYCAVRKALYCAVLFSVAFYAELLLLEQTILYSTKHMRACVCVCVCVISSAHLEELQNGNLAAPRFHCSQRSGGSDRVLVPVSA